MPAIHTPKRLLQRNNLKKIAALDKGAVKVAKWQILDQSGRKRDPDGGALFACLVGR